MGKPILDPMLEALCRERYGRLHAMATMLLGSPDGADDLVQEALISVFGKHRRFENVFAAEAYVRAAIASRLIDATRKRVKEQDSWRRYAMEAPVTSPGPDVSVRDVDVLLAALPPRIRACIVLRFLDDLSVRQTAAALGLSEGAVKRYVSDGLAKLSSALGSEGALVAPMTTVVESRRDSRG